MDAIARRLTALFVLGVLVYYSPILGAFNQPGSVGGLPLFPLYLFVAWGGLILAACLLVWRRRP